MASSIRRTSWEANNGLEEVEDQVRLVPLVPASLEDEETKAEVPPRGPPRNNSWSVTAPERINDDPTSADQETAPVVVIPEDPGVPVTKLFHLRSNSNILDDSLNHNNQDSLVRLDNDSLQEELDSVAPGGPTLQPDSLSFEEDTFAATAANPSRSGGSLEFYDSIGSNEKQNKGMKKLIIPYVDDSYSSNNPSSAFSSSREESLEANTGSAVANDNNNPGNIKDLTLLEGDTGPDLPEGRLPGRFLKNRSRSSGGLSPLLQAQNRLLPALPTTGIYYPGGSGISGYRQHHLQGGGQRLMGSNPDLRRHSASSSPHFVGAKTTSTPPPMGVSHHQLLLQPRPASCAQLPVSLRFSPAGRRQSGESPSSGVSPSTMQSEENLNRTNNNTNSLVRMATERMKKKFLNWS